MRLVQESLEAALPVQPTADSASGSSDSSPTPAEASAVSQPEQSSKEELPSGSETAANLSGEVRPADSNEASRPSVSMHAEEKAKRSPQQILRDALAHAHEGTRLPGSSTACVLQLDTASSTVSSAVLVSCSCHILEILWSSDSCSASCRFVSSLSGLGLSLKIQSLHQLLCWTRHLHGSERHCFWLMG